MPIYFLFLKMRHRAPRDLKRPKTALDLSDQKSITLKFALKKKREMPQKKPRKATNCKKIVEHIHHVAPKKALKPTNFFVGSSDIRRPHFRV